MSRKTAQKPDMQPELLVEMYRKMVRIRRFEDAIHLKFLDGALPGTVHLYQGQEAVAVGVCANLRTDDVITSTHRPHGHAIAKGVPIKSLMAELYGKSTGCCKGKGGSMHVGDASVGMLPAIAIVGGGLTIAAGCALAFKLKRKDNVAVSFLGDGAANEGDFHEALNMAAIWDLPVVYVCENNLYGASTRVNKVMKVKDVAERARAYGMPSAIADGNDVLAVYECVREAIERARSGGGPTLIECKTYRRCGHSRSDANAYRDKTEQQEWLARDPLVIARDKLKAVGALTDEDSDTIEAEIDAEIEEAFAFAEASPLPAPEDCLKDLWA
ncbi:MAG: thiamine pyrophosphate-dependent dehydrogenase E1 component subunit alpha [Armatimonadota bacterium]|nr:thiamine pyrophosphate-dependent dehydrogenase E1 component subunit alpha [Armatimonadota bacterium]